MKRWQDRGEVEDSEEDELSLDLESPRPGRPFKRAKHSQDATVEPDQPIVLIPFLDDALTAADRDGHVTSRPELAKTSSEEETASRSDLLDAEAFNPDEAIKDSGTASHEDVQATLSSPPPASDQLLVQCQTTPPSSSATLPALSDLPGPPRFEAEEQPTSTMSSPLSEREVSPPPGYQFPTSASHAARQARVVTEDLENDVGELNLPQSTALIRRNLRARKAIQLNPYQFDRQQYLQQCKARGLKPIRLVEQQHAQDEEADSQPEVPGSQMQDRSFVASSNNSGSQPQPSQVNRRGLDYFDIRDSSDDESQSRNRLPKRRKLGAKSGIHKYQSLSSRSMGTWDQLDEFSVPPSPPRTSSDLSNPDEGELVFKTTTSGFRIPLGLTPAPLPTPRISSDTKWIDKDEHSSDSPPRRSRMLSRRRQRESSIISIESSSSEQSDVELDVEATRLRREQKRIKGVLPASWLKIDFQAQQTTLARDDPTTRRLSTASPERREAQRGVARKVQRTTPRGHSETFMDLSSAQSDSEDDSRKRPSSPQQARLEFEHDRFTLGPSTAADDLVESDFIDPMLATSSRGQRKTTSRRTHQPRITEAFHAPSRARNDASTARRIKRTSHGVGSQEPSHRKGKGRRPRSKPAVRLSIFDAARQTSKEPGEPPQFIKLALRRARHEPDKGRHSPTHKSIRLATAEETEEAHSVLRAWRQGTIAIRDAEDSTPDGGSSQSINATRESPRPETLRGEHQPRFPNSDHQGRQTKRLTVRPARQTTARQTRLRPVQLSVEHRDTEHVPRPATPNSRREPRRGGRRSQTHRLRGAQLETSEQDFDKTHREIMFKRRMQRMTENISVPVQQAGAIGFQLERFLQPGAHASFEARSNHTERMVDDLQAGDHAPNTVAARQRIRKSRARRLDVDTRQYKQPSEPLPQEIDDGVLVDVDVAWPVLHGLGPFGTRYPVDFDLQPLVAGMFFDPSTFIGGGDLLNALETSNRDLQRESGHVRIHVGEDVFEWSAWTEDVAAQISLIPNLISRALSSLDESKCSSDLPVQASAVDHTVDYLLRSIVRYFSKCIWFIDAVDRTLCVERIDIITAALSDNIAAEWMNDSTRSKTVIRTLQYLVVIAKQAILLSNHPAVSVNLKSKSEELLSSSSKLLVKHGVTSRLESLRRFYEYNRRDAVREGGIEDDTTPLASIVLLRHVLKDTLSAGQLYWTIVLEAVKPDLESLCDLKVFESLWQYLFVLLPSMEIDAAGSVQTGSRFTANVDDWGVIKTILRRIFELYEHSSQVRGYSVNDYVRVVLSRCHCLINTWGWWRCEPVLNVIFDFFARRSFSLLNKEESRGSAKFLEALNSDTHQLEINADDCSFHIFLKMLATGARGMRKYNLCTDRKIQGILWRFIPNHGRTYKRDSALHATDLEALRNQHDLFSVLYYASPPQCRFDVNLVLGLVDHTTSHREACRLSVRAWTNIASYQASTSEPEDALEKLAQWFNRTIKTTLAQYKLAKIEAEQDFEQAALEIEHTGGAAVDRQVLETTIVSNQRQIASIIIDALAGLKGAIQMASNFSNVRLLVDSTDFCSVFHLFDPSQRRLLSAMQEALSICEAALDKQSSFEHSTQNAEDPSEDSQDFGDVSAIEAFVASQEAAQHANSVIADALLPSIGHFISNVFGADAVSDDSLLQQVVNVWTRLAGITVRESTRTWTSYVEGYDPNAWSQLRDTTQKRTFTPYLMKEILVQAGPDEEVKQTALVVWLLSLVEREALLKFQHSLTSVLLNVCDDEPLLYNVPFSKDRGSDRYDVSLAEIRQRRLALLSSVLCNMRTHYDEVSRRSSSSGHELRSQYAGMLRQLMQAMKTNYQELQSVQSNAVANASVQGGYVDFVQQVVSFLQQHALEICQVDRFFTDSAAFPLPATDPTYVIGRLRSYVPKLCESSGRTRLAVFIQSVSERAAVDNQQRYLVNQLAAAMADVHERGDDTAPTLRHVLLGSIFLAYIDKALSTSCSWIVALPVLQSCEMAIIDLLYSFQIEERDAALAVTSILSSVVHSICVQLERALAQTDILELPHVIRTLGSMIKVGKACLTVTSLIQRKTWQGMALLSRLETLRYQAELIGQWVQDPTDLSFIDVPSRGPEPTAMWPETRAAAERQVQDSVNTKWSTMGAHYYVQRGNTSKEVVVELNDCKVERAGLLHAIDEFCKAFDATLGGSQQTTAKRSACDDMLGSILV